MAQLLPRNGPAVGVTAKVLYLCAAGEITLPSTTGAEAAAGEARTRFLPTEREVQSRGPSEGTMLRGPRDGPMVPARAQGTETSDRFQPTPSDSFAQQKLGPLRLKPNWGKA